MSHKPICLPFASEGQYREYVDDPAQYRQYLGEMLSQSPELLPHGMDQGFTLHDAYASVKQDLIRRRITWIPGSRGSGRVRGFFDEAGLQPMLSQ